MKLQLNIGLVILTFISTPVLSLSETDKNAAIKAASLGAFRECAARTRRPLAIEAEGLDLNGDGKEEVMITVRHRDGGTACFSRIGQNKTLMIRNASGQWSRNLGFDADEIIPLSEKVDGYPDLEIGGPGFCFPVWRWNGSEYAIYKRCEDGKLVTVQAGARALPGSPSVSPQIWQPDESRGDIMYLHNGSIMSVNARLGEIRYDEPKSSIASTVSRGTILFKGVFKNDPSPEHRGTVNGTAYVFKKGCEPAPYAVSGTYDPNTIIMKGRAPKRAKNSCAVIENTSSSPHAILKFETPLDY